MTLFTILFDGIAYGMLLFLLASGLSVTLGLMNVINLAHGVFALAGGYLCFFLVNKTGLAFLAALPLVFICMAAVGAACEWLLFRRIYRRGALDQVLLTVGVVLMAVAGFDYALGSQQVFIDLPAYLLGQFEVLGIGIGRYRLLIILVCGALALAMQAVLTRTRLGQQLRAAVDDRDVASGLGINVPFIFMLTFAIGCGLAGLGGALGAEILGLDPHFPLKFLVLFLIVVSAGGTSSVTGPFVASLVLGIADVIGKYYFSASGAFLIYGLVILLLVAFPRGITTRPAT